MTSPPTSASPAAPIRVRLFAALREQAGWQERSLAVPLGEARATPAAIWDQLGLGPWPDGVRVAINHEFATLDQPLGPGDELAFLPPISGG